jgi:NADH-quinone oxidoreductase subunit A
MDKFILTPPVAFVIVLMAAFVFARSLSRLSYKEKSRPEGMGKPYACGEDVPSQMMQPDYGEFFPFAFFFTILHVVALIITTMPVATAGSVAIAVIYVLGALVSLIILFRK